MKLLAKYFVIFVSLLAFSIVGIGCVADDDSTNNDVITKEKNPEEEPVVLPESSSEPEVTYTIMFDKNAADATGTMESQTAKKSSRLTLAANAFVRSGYTFKGWNTKSDGKGANYSDKAAFKPMSDLKLFALWSKDAATLPDSDEKENPPPQESGSTETNSEAAAYRSGMRIVWQDEFDSADSDGTPLSAKWGYDVGRGTSTNSDGTTPGNWGWGNGEEQWYSNKDPDNTYVSDGSLKIVAKKEAAGDGASWTSGRLVTRNIYENKYGCIEMRAKISEAAGVWPAFWMLRHDIYDAGGSGWPVGGEIDIMESSTRVWGAGKVYGTLHCLGGYGGGPIWSQGMQLTDLENTWHTYAIVWNENGTISWYYDANLLGTYTANDKNNNDVWPYDENFYIILNLAVGGGLGGAIDPNLSNATMEVDYVRWYQ